MFPRWLTWLFLAVLAYMAYTADVTRRAAQAPVPTKTETPLMESEAYRSLAESLDSEEWKRRINPNYAASTHCALPKAGDDKALPFKLIEEVAGEGEGASCGEPVHLVLTIWNEAGAKAYEGEITLTLGARELAAGLDYGLQGIKLGGVRTLILPPKTMARGKGKSKLPEAVLRALPVSKMQVVTVKRLPATGPQSAS